MSDNTKNNIARFDLQIRIAQYLEQVSWSVNGVIHPDWFFLWNPTAGAVISCSNVEYNVTPDHAYLIPPYTTISACCTDKFDHLYAHFDAGEPFERANNQIYQLDPAPARRFYREQLGGAAARRMLYWRIMLLEYLAMLPEAALNNPAPTLDERVLKALNYLRDNWQSPVNNKLLAKRSGMSINNFYRRFREDFGITPQRYLMSVRLNAARNMLVNETLDIERIAGICGFADRYCFSKAFKNCFGVAPGAFRKQELEKNCSKN